MARTKSKVQVKANYEARMRQVPFQPQVIASSECGLCKRVFKDKSAIFHHTVAVHSEKKKCCHLCKSIFEDKSDLIIHNLVFHDTNYIVCGRGRRGPGLCKLKFRTEDEETSHNQAQHQTFWSEFKHEQDKHNLGFRNLKEGRKKEAGIKETDELIDAASENVRIKFEIKQEVCEDETEMKREDIVEKASVKTEFDDKTGIIPKQEPGMFDSNFNDVAQCNLNDAGSYKQKDDGGFDFHFACVVRGLEKDGATRATLLQHFNQFGEVVKMRIRQRFRKGKKAPFVTVNFKEKSGLQASLVANHEELGKTVVVTCKAYPKPEKVHVSLPPEIQNMPDSFITDFFETSYGPIIAFERLVSRNDELMNSCCITFKNYQASQLLNKKRFVTINGLQLEIGRVEVLEKEARKRASKAKRLAKAKVNSNPEDVPEEVLSCKESMRRPNKSKQDINHALVARLSANLASKKHNAKQISSKKARKRPSKANKIAKHKAIAMSPSKPKQDNNHALIAMLSANLAAKNLNQISNIEGSQEACSSKICPGNNAQDDTKLLQHKQTPVSYQTSSNGVNPYHYQGLNPNYYPNHYPRRMAQYAGFGKWNQNINYGHPLNPIYFGYYPHQFGPYTGPSYAHNEDHNPYYHVQGRWDGGRTWMDPRMRPY